MKFNFLLSVCLLSSTSVFAAVGPDGQVTSDQSSFVDQLHASLFANYHGPSVTNPNAETLGPTGTINTRQRQYFDSEVMGYLGLGPSSGVGIVVPFFLMTTKGGDFTLGDVGGKIFEKKTITAHNFSLGTNLILQAPTSSYSRERGVQFSVKTTPSVRYDIPNSRFSIGAWTELKAYLGALYGKTFKAYAAPYLSYQLVPKFSLFAEYEYEADTFYGAAPLGFQTYQTDILTGVQCMITPTLIVSPFVAFYTTQQISIDRAALGATISASI